MSGGDSFRSPRCGGHVGGQLYLLTTFMALAVVGGCHGGGPAEAPGAAAAPQVIAPTREALIARARSLELDTPYVPPPGDPLEHQTAGFAKVMCSAVFITGLDPDFAAENVGYFTGPYLERARVGKPVIDRAAKAVRVTIPSGPTLTARYLGSQGCVTLPAGRRTVHFTPVQVTSALPDASTQPWPMGDALPDEPLPGRPRRGQGEAGRRRRVRAGGRDDGGASW